MRQWATNFIEKGRKIPRHPTDEGFVAIASFLMHPGIEMLSEKELNEPEIPYRFAAFLLDFLKHPAHNQPFPPKELRGLYLAHLKADDGTIRRIVELALEVRKGDHVICISEKSYPGDVEAVDYDVSPKKALFGAIYRAKGWGHHSPSISFLL